MNPKPSICLEVAASIAHAIMRNAIWHEGRCSWIGAIPEDDGRGGVAINYHSLGPDLYGGTAGIGLFLAEVAGAADDADARAVAAGALRHAASRADTIPETSASGLYAGRYGIALALAYAAPMLDEPALAEQAREILATTQESKQTGEFDLISGHAGAIVSLLSLSELIDDRRLVERAAIHGDALVASAEPRDGGLCWTAGSVSSTERLAGYSHGAGGVAAALLELAAATGEQRYRDASAGAFGYERSLYDGTARNWPDLRENALRPSGTPPTFTTFWCHGAPGIALSRIRALELGADEAARDEALIALDTTAAWTEAALPAGMNYSLCHGLAGNAEILDEGAALAGDRVRMLAARVACEGIERYFAPGLSWPSGAHQAPTPSLFLGDAGVGRFYLRRAFTDLPSLLLVRPTGFGKVVRSP